MNSKDVIKRLKKEGWVRTGGRGDHQKFKHPNFKLHITIPHPRKDLSIGVVNDIKKKAGWK